MPGSWTHKQKLLSLVGGGVALSLIAVFVLTRAVRSAAEPAPADQRPSMGCGIKWTPGNEPT